MTIKPIFAEFRSMIKQQKYVKKNKPEKLEVYLLQRLFYKNILVDQ